MHARDTDARLRCEAADRMGLDGSAGALAQRPPQPPIYADLTCGVAASVCTSAVVSGLPPIAQ